MIAKFNSIAANNADRGSLTEKAEELTTMIRGRRRTAANRQTLSRSEQEDKIEGGHLHSSENEDDN